MLLSAGVEAKANGFRLPPAVGSFQAVRLERREVPVRAVASRAARTAGSDLAQDADKRIPEPASFLLIGSSLLLIGGLGARRVKQLRGHLPRKR